MSTESAPEPVEALVARFLRDADTLGVDLLHSDARHLVEAVHDEGWMSPERHRIEVNKVAKTIEVLDSIAIEDWRRHAAELKAEIDRLHECLRFEADAHADERTRLRSLIREVRAPLDDPSLPFMQAALKARQVFQDYDAERAAGESS